MEEEKINEREPEKSIVGSFRPELLLSFFPSLKFNLKFKGTKSWELFV